MGEKKMKALVKTRRESGAELSMVDIPSIGDNEVLIKVKAAAICGTDVHVYRWNAFAQEVYQKIPNIMGHELAGVVVEKGRNVFSLEVGDFVSAETHITCGHCPPCQYGQPHLCDNMKIIGFDIDGCFADYVALPDKVVWKNEASLPLDLAAVQEPLGNAIYTALVEPVTAKSVVVFGDGPIGLFAVAVCKASGARKTILVGLDPLRMKIGEQVGADAVLSAEEKNLEEKIRDSIPGGGADVVLEMAGAEQAVTNGLNVLRKGGRFSAFGIHQDKVRIDYNQLLLHGITLYGIHGRLIFDSWIKARNLLASGNLNIRPIITHHLPLTDYRAAFDLVLSKPIQAGKVLLYPDPAIIPSVRQERNGE